MRIVFFSVIGKTGEELLGAFLLGMVDDLFRVALFHNDAAVHEDDAVGYVPGKGHLVGDNDHGHIFLRQGADDLQNFAGQFRVKRGGRLIKEKDLRIHGQCASNGYTLLLTDGELLGIGVSFVGQPHFLKQGHAALDSVVLAAAKHIDLCIGQILQHGVVGEKVEILEDQTEIAADIL